MAHDARDPFLDREPAKHAIFSMHPQEYAIHRTSGWRCHATPATIMDGNPCHGAMWLRYFPPATGSWGLSGRGKSAGCAILAALSPPSERGFCRRRLHLSSIQCVYICTVAGAFSTFDGSTPRAT